MMKFFPKFPRKNEKGQVLVVVALTFIALVAIVGLAVDMGYMYVSYARLRRGVDAAALAGTGEFRIPDAYIGTGLCPYPSPCRTKRDQNISAAIQQFLDLNGIEPDSTAGWTNPLTGQVGGITVETCEDNLGDQDIVDELCKEPWQKIIRVAIQQRVPLFFLAVIGLHEVPIVIDSFASAASADVMLALDTSDSMTYDLSSDNRDPHACNGPPSYCEPMESVKDAANAFADRLYYPYDRLGIATFDQYAYVKLALSTDIVDIHLQIDAIRVFEGVSTPLDDGTMSGTKCIYFRDYKNIDPAPDAAPGSDDDPSYPWAYNPDAGYWDFNDHAGAESPPQRLVETGNAVRYFQDPYGPCRLFDEDGGGFVQMDCPGNYGPDATPERCGTTNIGGAIDIATRALTGIYPDYISSPPARRDDSVWVLVLLTDGAANAAYNSLGHPLCPPATWPYKTCRHPDANHRTIVTDPLDPDDPEYDAQDQPRDMFDIALSDNINVFTIGLGEAVTQNPPFSTGPAPGEFMLKYPETAAPIHGGSAKYFFASDPSDLFPIFVEIANLITSRINQ